MDSEMLTTSYMCHRPSSECPKFHEALHMHFYIQQCYNCSTDASIFQDCLKLENTLQA